MLLYACSSFANDWEVSDDDEKAPKKPLEQWQVEDAARLRALYKSYRTNGGLDQEKFAVAFGLKSQGNMGHYLHGRRPLNLRAAISFARGLGCDIEAFSPTLGAEALPLAGESGWPFPDIDPQMFARLSPSQKLEAQGVMRRTLLDLLSPPGAHLLGGGASDEGPLGPFRKAG